MRICSIIFNKNKNFENRIIDENDSISFFGDDDDNEKFFQSIPEKLFYVWNRLKKFGDHKLTNAMYSYDEKMNIGFKSFYFQDLYGYIVRIEFTKMTNRFFISSIYYNTELNNNDSFKKAHSIWELTY